MTRRRGPAPISFRAIGQAPGFLASGHAPQRLPQVSGSGIRLRQQSDKVYAGFNRQNSVLYHGKDLSFSLARARQLDRPIIFVAHRLGGIIVKEMLAQSFTATDEASKNVV